ncbi:MAG: LPS-assembly protein LptD [Ignavibacteriae bacterium]|nr:LPS-assembly protein LptD [Ignavibacteriota bacterium]
MFRKKNHKNSILKFFVAIALFIALLTSVQHHALSQTKEAVKKTLPVENKVDSSKKNLINSDFRARDSVLKIYRDSILKKSDSSNTEIGKSKPGIDSIVIYSAKDSVRFTVGNKMMRLKGDAKIKLKAQSLESEIIEMNFGNSNLKAEGTRDSNRKVKGYPKFTDQGEFFVGEKMSYNFQNKQGTISFGETEISNGFYFGEKIKRVSENELFVRNGCYTTCDEPHPHFYIGSPEMKVIANEKVYMDPIIFYVEDMPLFIVPVGLFFPSRGGRQSGLIIPSFFFSKDRGVVLQDLGLYLALSDYYDTQFKVDYYSKGGYLLKNQTRWKLLDNFEGSLDADYGKIRLKPDDEYNINYKFVFTHNQTLTPQSNIVANMSFMSPDFNRNTSMNYQDRLIQNINSNASYSQNFDNGMMFSLSFNRDQNIITGEYQQTFPQVSWSVPSWKPFKSIAPSGNWLGDISIKYGVSGKYYQDKVIQYDSAFVDSTQQYKQDTTIIFNTKSSINHNPSISISPKLGYFTITPSFNIRANNYFKRLTRTYDSTDSSTNDTFENGFFTEYNYNFGISAQTRLYGIVKPEIFGLKALRHTFQPTFSFSYTPNLSNPSFGFYDSYYNTSTKKYVQYSRYEVDGGGIASKSLSRSLGFEFLNNFDAKIASKDTNPDQNVSFFVWKINGSYNMAADSLRFSDINMNFRIPDLKFITLNADAGFTVYDEARTYNQTTGELTNNYAPINKFLIENGKGLMRLKRLGLTLSTAFSSEGISTGYQGEEPEVQQTPKDSIGLGDRFRRRLEYTDSTFDNFGDNTPGYSSFRIPWQLSFNLRFDYNNPTLNTFSKTLNLSTNLSFKLTDTWDFKGTAQYDFINKKLLAPNLSIVKDLHCWELSFSWTPNFGYYLHSIRFLINSFGLSAKIVILKIFLCKNISGKNEENFNY